MLKNQLIITFVSCMSLSIDCECTIMAYSRPYQTKLPFCHFQHQHIDLLLFILTFVPSLQEVWWWCVPRELEWLQPRRWLRGLLHGDSDRLHGGQAISVSLFKISHPQGQGTAPMSKTLLTVPNLTLNFNENLVEKKDLDYLDKASRTIMSLCDSIEKEILGENDN